MEAVLLAHEFQCHRPLAQTMDTAFSAMNELFNSQFVTMAGGGGEREGEREEDTMKISVVKSPEAVFHSCDGGAHTTHLPLGMGMLVHVVAGGRRYIQEFVRMGVFEGRGAGGALHEDSMVFSDVSGTARASLRLKANTLTQVHMYVSTHTCTSSSLTLTYILKSLYCWEGRVEILLV